ncbi:hypothetical protein ACTQ49_14510 [Luteococcus sp. Sow4_B9]|uniref:hypothetical protein n=1 Tax=Luteococcus sp. Sow4_B9 TaxID=3438792 RepID=UPI003F9C0432
MARSGRLRVVLPGDLPALLPTCDAHGELDALLQDPGATWARAAMDQWGLCGVVLVNDDSSPEAQLLVCPGLQLPPDHPLVHWSRLPDAAYLLALVTEPDDADNRGLPQARTRLLVQALSRRLAGDVATVEAAASLRGGTCLEPPMDWLAGAGFTGVPEPRADGRVRMRLSLESTSRWIPDLHRAKDLLQGLLPRPVPPVEPTGRDGHGAP